MPNLKQTFASHLFASRLFAVTLVLLLAGCGQAKLPDIPAPDLSKLPGIPESLRGVSNLWNDLGLPDISQVANLPALGDLPGLETPPGGIAYAGPTEARIDVGEHLAGTNIALTAVNSDGAQFEIAGQRSVRKIGDSLDFDGAWPGSSGTQYTLRLRIYIVADTYVRAAGVHRLVINNIQPVMDNPTLPQTTLKFPFTAGAKKGEQFTGLTLQYLGSDNQGGQIGGLPQGDYPYRKIGDSILWKGHLRPDIPVDYNVRMLLYTADQAQIGGIVTVAMPGQ